MTRHEWLSPARRGAISPESAPGPPAWLCLRSRHCSDVGAITRPPSGTKLASMEPATTRRLGHLTAQLGTLAPPPPPAALNEARAGAPGGESGGVTITATVPLVDAPEWAVLERQLISVMEEAVHPFLAKYTHPDGRLVYERFPGRAHPGRRGEADLKLEPNGKFTAARDGLDDFYESFYNWPLLYLLGGSAKLLELGQRQFDATTRLGEEMGHVHKEYEVGYDQFHQSESMIYFYLLCMADPTHKANAKRAARFASFFMNEDPEDPENAPVNYSFEHKILMSAHNGSLGARETIWGSYGGPGFTKGSMARYGLPYEDVPGVSSVEDLELPDNAAAMGVTMQRRMGMGDTSP